MKTVLFCNLIPLKTGAYEALLAAIGQEFKKSGDEYVVVFSGDPISEVANSLRAAGVRWCVLEGWTAGPEEENTPHLNPLPQGERKDGNQEGLPLPPHHLPPLPARERVGVRGSSLERVNPWGFVLPAVRLICLERPDVVAVHFGNEMPTLVASLLCRLMGWCSRLSSILTTQQLNNPTTFHPPRWVWEQDQQIQDPGRISRWASKLRIMGLGVDRYLAVYEGGRQSMLKRGIPAEKITVIHNSVAPYTPTRPKGWLREELGAGRSGQWALSSGQGSEKKSDAQVAADVPAAEIESANQAHRSPFDFAHGRPGTSLRQGYVGQASNATMRNAPYASHLTSHVSPPEVLLITNGSLIPRKRIDFILKACALLQKEKSISREAAKSANENSNFNICATGASACGGDKQDSQDKKSAVGERGLQVAADVPAAVIAGGHKENTFAETSLRQGYVGQASNATLRCPSLVSPLPPWRLLVIGEGPERERLGALATALGIANRVHFLGLRNDVREILPECDIYLHASKAETCTYAVTESMAAGIPAVMLNAGAAKEQIENGVTGYVFDVLDPIPFAAYLSDLMVDSVRRGEMGRLAQSRWETLFRVELAAVRYHDMYAKMA